MEKSRLSFALQGQVMPYATDGCPKGSRPFFIALLVLFSIQKSANFWVLPSVLLPLPSGVAGHGIHRFRRIQHRVVIQMRVAVRGRRLREHEQKLVICRCNITDDLLMVACHVISGFSESGFRRRKGNLFESAVERPDFKNGAPFIGAENDIVFGISGIKPFCRGNPLRAVRFAPFVRDGINVGSFVCGIAAVDGLPHLGRLHHIR